MEDGKLTSAVGTQDTDSFVESLIASLPSIYEKENSDTILRKLYAAVAKQFVKADITLESVANNNFISISISDELVIRGKTERDRLQNENAYQVDSIRFSQSSSIIEQNVFLQVGENSVQLLFLPVSIDFSIFPADENQSGQVNFPATYDKNSNQLIVSAPVAGKYKVSYKETGDVLSTTEKAFVSPGIFELGFSEGGFSELGYSE